MKITRARLYIAAAVAFLMGFPLVEEAQAQTSDIIFSSLGLASAIINLAGNS